MEFRVNHQYLMQIKYYNQQKQLIRQLVSIIHLDVHYRVYLQSKELEKVQKKLLEMPLLQHIQDHQVQDQLFWMKICLILLFLVQLVILRCQRRELLMQRKLLDTSISILFFLVIQRVHPINQLKKRMQSSYLEP